MNILSKHGVPGFKCYLKCLFCSTRVPCTYYKHWQASNYENHLKSESASGLNRNESDPEKDIDPAHIANNTEVSVSGKQNNESDKERSVEKLKGKSTSISSSKTSGGQNSKRLSVNAAVQGKIDDVLNLNTLDLNK